MATFCSLRDFLRTGRLGPIRHALTPADVVAMLGCAPHWLGVNAYGLPDRWAYGRLALGFGAGVTALSLDTVTINELAYLHGDCEVIRVGASLPDDRADAAPAAIAGALVMKLDGLGDGAPLPTFLRLFADRTDARVMFGPFDEFSCGIEIHAGSVVTAGSIDVEALGDGPLGGLSEAELFRHAIEQTTLSSATAFSPDAASRLQRPWPPRHTVPVQDLLAAAS